MKTLQTFLIENVQIGLAKHAYKLLSYEAKDALDRWEVSGWVGGPLEKHIRANDQVAQEIEALFAPIRAKLPPKIKLYRGMIKDENANHYHGRLLQSWTDDRKVAEHFAGLRGIPGMEAKSYLYQVHTDKEIADAVATYNRTGFVTFDGKRYKRNKDNPDYFDVYDSSRYHVVDDEDLHARLTSSNDYAKQSNAEKQEQGVILEQLIPREKIVWITNNLNSKEYIVRV